MKNKTILKNEGGFTLIEVIAVLIILGILAAVAVPKYFDLTQEASKKAAEGAVAQGLSLCTLAYSKIILEKGTDDVTGIIALIVTEAEDATASLQGEFDLSFEGTEPVKANDGTVTTLGNIVVTATVKDADPDTAGTQSVAGLDPDATANRTWYMP